MSEIMEPAPLQLGASRRPVLVEMLYAKPHVWLISHAAASRGVSGLSHYPMRRLELLIR